MGSPLPTTRTRRGIRVRGTVQGVGFRPAMYRLARAFDLAGFVRNDDKGVWMEVEGGGDDVARFVAEIPRTTPPRARIDAIETAPMEPTGDHCFSIATSSGTKITPHAPAAIPPDLAPCARCLGELDDPRDRRHRYAFINCTDCGPRFTIVRGLPYDRAQTTMDAFALCDDCRREYEHPGDRRFHAEPNACPACGPRLTFVRGGHRVCTGAAALAAATRALAAGEIVAVKGAGGFALTVSAGDERAVTLLRARKRRPHKPLAVMARDVHHARRVAELSDAALRALTSPARPIVIVPARAGTALAPSVAPGVADVGVFLPPTPLQYLLVRDGPPLVVMTSGNSSGRPIVTDNAEAIAELGEIADVLLLHDRDIHAAADDSILRAIGDEMVPIRRARGYAPDAIPIPVPGRPVLAVGAQSKSTVCIAARGKAVLSPHIGDLAHPRANARFQAAIDHLRALTRAEPLAVAHDAHPDYRSTRYALACGLAGVPVQHHHAHIAACLVEHGRLGPVIGVVFDGTGYGWRGGLWGGEIMLADLGGFRRLGALRALALPGGEAAIREPWRLALSALADAGEPDEPLRAIDPDRRRAVAALIGRSFAAPRATGAGRWFDAVAALCGLRHRISYDGQAAVELEAAASAHSGAAPAYEIPSSGGAPFEIDMRAATRCVARDLRRGAPVEEIAARFHHGLAAAVRESCRRARAAGAPATVALTGGCFQNRIFAERTRRLLEEDDFEVLTHRAVPPNDGGISLGQAAVASFRLGTGEQR